MPFITIRVVENDTPPAPEPTGVRRVRRWGDPVMMQLMGYDTDQVGGNFQVVALFTPLGEFGAVQQFQKLDAAAMVLLQSLQKSEGAITFEQKMNWLCSDGEGRPYWTTGGKWSTTWSAFFFGTLVFGGQKISIEMANGAPVEYTFFSKYKTETGKHNIPFYKLQGLGRADLPRVYSGEITHATHPHLLQKCTAANAGGAGNVYTETPRGTLYHPVWDPRDWACNNGNALYVAKAFLE